MKSLFSGIIASLLSVFTTTRSPAQGAVAMDPSDILFTTPTLNDALPDLSAAGTTSNTIYLHEDDWRQFEFIDRSHKEAVSRELEAIGEIWDEHSKEVGDFHAFTKVHVRKEISNPLSIDLPKEDFELLIGGGSSGLSFQGYDNELSDVVAAKNGGYVIYGQIQRGRMTVFGLEKVGNDPMDTELALRIKEFADENELVLVHWRSRSVVHPNDRVYEMLTGK